MSLEKTFDLPEDTSDLQSLEERIDVSIPKDAQISDIAKLALEAYRIQVQDIPRIEPKYRARAFEVAQAYLAVASDALSNSRAMALKERLADLKDNSDPKDKSPRIPKAELMDEISKAHKFSAVR